MSPLEENFKRVADGIFIAQGSADLNPAYIVVHSAIELLERGAPIQPPHGYTEDTLRKMLASFMDGKTRIDSAQAVTLAHLGGQVMWSHPDIEQFEIDAIAHLARIVGDAKKYPL